MRNHEDWQALAVMQLREVHLTVQPAQKGNFKKREEGGTEKL